MPKQDASMICLMSRHVAIVAWDSDHTSHIERTVRNPSSYTEPERTQVLAVSKALEHFPTLS